MIYKIREKFWSLGSEYAVTDAHDRKILHVEGPAFSWGNKLSIADIDGREVAYIEQELFVLKPRYRIYRDGRPFAELVKEWSWFQKSFTLDVPGPNDYAIRGSFWQHEFRFERSGRSVARVSRSFGFTDHYGIDVVDGEDDVSIICACLVIDQILDDDRR